MVKIPESELSGRSFNPDLGFAELTREPVKALVKTMALHCAGCLNVPLGKKQVIFFWKKMEKFRTVYPSVSEVLKSQLVSEL